MTPINKLQEGTILTIAEIETRTGKIFGTSDYSLALIALSGAIEQATGIVCKQEKGKLRLLRDGKERAAYCDDQLERAARAVIKNAKRTQNTTPVDMDEAEARDLEHQSRVSAILAQHSKKMLRDRAVAKSVPVVAEE